MAHTIKVKRSETAGATPSGADLSTHEIAMNVNDGKIFTKAANGSIEEVANKVTPGSTEASISVRNRIRIELWHQHLNQRQQ